MSMGPERLQLWLLKAVPGGRSVQLVHDQAVGQGLVVAMWMKEEIDEAKEAGTGLALAEHVIEAAQDHADSVGESCRFLIQWTNDTMRPLRSIIHRAIPTEKPTNEHAQVADQVSVNAMVGQLLNHIATQQRVINGSIGVVLSAYDRAMTMQQNMIDTLGRRLDALPAATTAEVTAVDAQVQELKAQALQKLVDLGPDIVRLGISAISDHKHRVSPEVERQAFALVAAEEAARKRANGQAAPPPTLVTTTAASAEGVTP